MSRASTGFRGWWVVGLRGLRSSVYSDIRENLAYFKGLFDLQTAGRTTWNLRGSKVLANWARGVRKRPRDSVKEPFEIS